MVNLCLVHSDDALRVENVPSPPSPEQPPLAPNDPPFPSPRGLRELEAKQQVAIAIALQTHVLQTCPEHNEIYCDDEQNPAAAFALAIDLVRHRAPYVGEFSADSAALTDLMTLVIATAPTECPHCLGRTAYWNQLPNFERMPLHP